MSKHAHTPAPTQAPTLAQALAHADAAANPGMRTMRLTLAGMAACKAHGLAPREAPPAQPASRVSASKRTVPASKPAPAQDAPETPESMRDWRVCVLVSAGDAQTHVWVAVSAAGPRRASGQARAEARRAGHEPVGVCAVLRDDAPQALLDAAR
jgi:hypothetical protein